MDHRHHADDREKVASLSAAGRASSIIQHVGCINIFFLPIKDTRNYGAFEREHVQHFCEVDTSQRRCLDREAGGGEMGRSELASGCFATVESPRLRYPMRSADQSLKHVRGKKKKRERGRDRGRGAERKVDIMIPV